jgi:transposase
MSGPIAFVGIDVSKAHLDVALLPDATTFRVANDPDGGAELIARIASNTPPTVVLEATGSYHVGITLALAAAGMPPAVMNPEQTHAFIQSEGQRTKTDRIDARLLARFGQQKRPSPSPVLTQNARDLRELVACRDDFTKLLTMEKNRLHVVTDRTRSHHQAVIDHLVAERRTVEREIAALIAADAALTERLRIVRSRPGIGVVLGPVVLAGLGELGQDGAKGLASLAGVAPHIQQSGTRKAHGAIRGGRGTIRKALYQMAVTAVTRNPVMKAHFRQLRRRLPYKAAIIACARRMLGILNAMVREGLTWKETKVGQGQFLPDPA